MKKGWTYKKLGDICKLYQPHTISSKEMVDDGKYDVFGANGIIGKYNQYNHEEPEILMTCRGATCGNINVSTPKSWINGNAMVVHIKDEKTLNKSFLIYILSHIDKTHIITGAAQPQITRQTLSPLMIGYPTLSEQERIVERLDAAFAQIDELKSNAEKQLAEARALFQSALTQAMQPKPGWQEKTLPDISENLDSIRVPVTKKNRSEGIYPYYGASGIVDYVDDYLFDEDLLCISEDGANLIMRTYPIAFPIKGKVWVNNHAHVLRFNNLTTQKYVEYYFEGLKLDEYITGAAQPKLTQKALNRIVINLPSSITEQQRIVSCLDALSNHVKELEEISRKTAAECDAMKQALLRQIFE